MQLTDVAEVFFIILGAKSRWIFYWREKEKKSFPNYFKIIKQILHISMSVTQADTFI